MSDHNIKYQPNNTNNCNYNDKSNGNNSGNNNCIDDDSSSRTQPQPCPQSPSPPLHSKVAVLAEEEEEEEDPMMLTKYQKGRLKKLRRRAFLTSCAGQINKHESNGQKLIGLVTSEEVDELRNLLEQVEKVEKYNAARRMVDSTEAGNVINESNSSFSAKKGSIVIERRRRRKCPLAGSSIVLSNGDFELRNNGGGDENDDEWQHCEGIDHRNLLLRLMFHDSVSPSKKKSTKEEKRTKAGQKRKRDEERSAVVVSQEGNNEYGHGLQEKQMNGGGNGNGNSNSNSNSNNNEDDGDFKSDDDDDGTKATITREWLKKSLPPVPSWARIHNPACASHFAVIEFSMEDMSGVAAELRRRRPSPNTAASSLCWMPSSCLLSNNNTNAKSAKSDDDDCCGGDDKSGENKAQSTKSKIYEHLKALLSRDGLQGRRATPTTTRLFRGDRPMQISDVLLYMDFDLKKKADGGEDTSTTCHNDGARVDICSQGNNVVERLRQCGLSRSQMAKEGYPLIGCLKKKTGALAETIDLNRDNCELLDKTIEDVNSFPFTHKKATEIVEGLSTVEEIVTEEEGAAVDRENSPKVERFVPTVLLNNGRDSRIDESQPCTGAPSDHGPRVFALDCEMVRTTAGMELARVTLIRHKPSQEDPEAFSVVMDALVKPRLPIVDYLSEYSGITAKVLEGVDIRIEDVQAAFVALVHVDDLVVGHSLENDLRALRVVHNCVVDTAVLFSGEGGRKHALRHLSLVLLKKNIQDGNNGSVGHCSVEDAATSLTLALRRARIGEGFKLRSKRDRRKHVMEIVDSVRKTSGRSNGAYPVTRDRGPMVLIGPDEWIRRHVKKSSSAHALVCESIASENHKAIFAWLASKTRRASLLWANLVVNACARDCRRIDEIVGQVVEQAPSSTAILFIFQRNYKRANRLTQQRRASKDPKATLIWTVDLETAWQESVESSRYCDAFWVGVA